MSIKHTIKLVINLSHTLLFQTRNYAKTEHRYIIKLNDGTMVNLEDEVLALKLGFTEVSYYEVLLQKRLTGMRLLCSYCTDTVKKSIITIRNTRKFFYQMLFFPADVEKYRATIYHCHAAIMRAWFPKENDLFKENNWYT